MAEDLVQKGYWQNEDETGKVIRRDEDGTEWMCTGDEAVMDDLGKGLCSAHWPRNITLSDYVLGFVNALGYVSIVGRIKDLIIRGEFG